nr:unnamed protein product [Callosobruchus analis]
MAQQQDTVAAMSNDDVQLLKNLIKKRGSVKFRITHVKKYLDRIESDLSVLSELDKAELRQKSSRMPQLFDEFASIQCEIETLSDSSDQFEERIEFENSYDLCMARINCILTNDGFDNDSKRSDKSGVSLVSNNTKQSCTRHTRGLLSENVVCTLCKKSHSISNCSAFSKLNVNERISKAKYLRLCLNCLKPGHFNYVCRANTCKNVTRSTTCYFI